MHTRRVLLPGRKVRVVQLHREVMGAPPGMLVDHVNGNTLDNRRCNLRVATHGQNLANRKAITAKSGFKGAFWAKWAGRWYSSIGVNGRVIRLGYFDTPEAAALAYDEAARKHHGEFACVNFPRPGEQGTKAA